MKTKIVFRVSEDNPEPDAILRRRILGTAGDLFFKHGFIRITVDDIASELGISKATLYKCFRSKDDLLAAAVENVKHEIRAGIRAIMEEEKRTVLEKMSRLMAYVGSWLSKLSPVMARDLRRSAPGVWEDMEKFRRDNILVNFKTIMDAGIIEGVIKKDIRRDLMVQMYLNLVENFLNPGVLLESSCSARDIFETVITIFFEGILTDRAKREYSKRKMSLFKLNKEVMR